MPFLRRHTALRVVVATLAAVTVGNMIWGHLTLQMYFYGVEYRQFGEVFGMWPYFLLLGLGIAATELYLLRRGRRRRPWTPGPGLIGDVAAAYCTVQFYSLLHIFVEPRGEASVADLFRLWLIGFGIHI
jgi:hypothetical protein